MTRPIVIEGPDGAGKSTLGMVLGARHAGGPPKTLVGLRARIGMLENDTVYDRWSAISEIVYPPNTGRDRLLPYEELVAGILRHNPIIIYCKAPLGVRQHNIQRQMERNQKDHKGLYFHRMVLKNAAQIGSDYQALMEYLKKMEINVIEYDYTKGIKNEH